MTCIQTAVGSPLRLSYILHCTNHGPYRLGDVSVDLQEWVIILSIFLASFA